MANNHMNRYQRGIKVAPFLFLAPNVLIFVIFVIIPMFMGFFYSFTDFKGLGRANWVGLANFARLLKDRSFYLALGNTLWFVICGLIVLYVVSLLLAYQLTKPNQVLHLFQNLFLLAFDDRLCGGGGYVEVDSERHLRCHQRFAQTVGGANRSSSCRTPALPD